MRPTIEFLESRLTLSQTFPTVGAAPIGPPLGTQPGTPVMTITRPINEMGAGEGAPLPIPVSPNPVGSFPPVNMTIQVCSLSHTYNGIML